MKKTQSVFEKRKQRIRTGLLKSNSLGRARLTVCRTNKHLYAQIIDDKTGRTLVSASTVEAPLRTSLKSTSNKEAAKEVGSVLAKKALENGVNEVVFDRSGYIFHGRVAMLASSARENGLKF